MTSKQNPQPTLDEAIRAAVWLAERLEDAHYFGAYVVSEWPWLTQAIDRNIHGGDDDE